MESSMVVGVRCLGGDGGLNWLSVRANRLSNVNTIMPNSKSLQNEGL